MMSWLRRLLKQDVPAPKSLAGQSIVDDLRSQIRRDVAGGFYDEDVILRNAVDVFDGEADADLVRREALVLLRQALAEQSLAERNWPAQTDCDRLDAAFAALEVDGVISRQNFTCCGTCGAAEMVSEMEEAGKGGQLVRGYAFFHQQDTESAVEGDGVFLNYGACENDDAAAVRIGQEIVAKLNAQGLRTDWDGSIARRIHVPMDWKRRRMGSIGK